MAGGESAAMTAIDLERAGGRRETVVLRRPDAEAGAAAAVAHEARVLAALEASGIPAPRLLDTGLSRGPPVGPCLVLTFLDGAPDYDPPDPAAAARRMAGFLARLHAVDARRDDLAAVARRNGPLDDGGAPPSRNPEALLHGDFWAGNLLWRDGRLVGAVDWEDVAVGDPLADLAIARADMAWAFGREAVAAFTADYARLTGFDLSALPFWDARAVRRQAPHAADYAEGWRDLGRADVTEATIRAAHARLLAAAPAER